MSLPRQLETVMLKPTPRDMHSATGDLPADAFRDARASRRRLGRRLPRDDRSSGASRPSSAPGRSPRASRPSLPRRASPIEEILGQLDTAIMPGIVHWGHPAFLGYFGSTSNGPALLGEIVAAALNVSAMTWQTSPAATELETVVLGWIRQMVGAAGDVHGRRLRHGVDRHAARAGRRERALRRSTSARAESRGAPTCRSIASTRPTRRTARSRRRWSCSVSAKPTSSGFRATRPSASTSRRSARRCWTDRARAIVRWPWLPPSGRRRRRASIRFARSRTSAASYGVWLHVDAAYGGALAILPERTMGDGRRGAADSVIVNPHKWMFVPLDFSVLFVRRPELLRTVFALTPEYLRGDAGGGDVNYMDYGIQLGRRFRALKAWMAFSAFGRDGHRGAHPRALPARATVGAMGRGRRPFRARRARAHGGRVFPFRAGRTRRCRVRPC